MRRALEPDQDLIGDDEPQRDLVLGIPALLGIFVAAVLICAVCFGFGYSSGHGFHFSSGVPSQTASAQPAAKPAPMPLPSQTDAADGTDTNGSPITTQDGAQTAPDLGANPADANSAAAPTSSYTKPNPGLAYQAPAKSPAETKAAAPKTPAAPAQTYQPANRPTGATPQSSAYTHAVPVPIAQPASTAVKQPSQDGRAVPAPKDAAAASPAGSPIALMVQIAAVTQFADAQTLASALRHDGFSAIVRTTTGDPYFHVQVGPFSSYEAAKSMRQRLTADGYSAFIRR
jgi:cell division septation protein DedD